jgi:hypothetical protein
VHNALIELAFLQGDDDVVGTDRPNTTMPAGQVCDPIPLLCGYNDANLWLALSNPDVGGTQS